MLRFLLGLSTGFLITLLGVIGVYTTATPTVDVPAQGEYRYVEMNVSAYCPCEKCCEKWSDGITASGSKAEGKLIAAPSKYPFGTMMDIPGYGVAIVEDRGGAIKGNKIDLLFEDKDGVSGHQRALEWGRQLLKVRVYKDREEDE